jgi:hypothetical protein
VIWLEAIYPGDAQYQRAVQQAQIAFPIRNNEGAEQSITFPPIPDQKIAAQPLKLNATSSVNGSLVHYYVREGPAELVNGDTLQFTPIPPRAKFPISVTVVAWQWGRSIDPRVQSAQPVERSFNIVK